uniref:Uncharacterized protein n=1 Tax=Vitis vinifera TaxID=29760 RepID=F6H5D0_VITVI
MIVAIFLESLPFITLPCEAKTIILTFYERRLTTTWRENGGKGEEKEGDRD